MSLEPPDTSCCFLLRNSAIAAAPVKGNGDAPRADAGDSVLCFTADLAEDVGVERFPLWAAPLVVVLVDVGVRGTLSTDGRDSVLGVAVRVVAAISTARA